MTRLKVLGVVSAVLMLFAAVMPAHADTIQGVTVGGIQFQADLNANTSTHTYTLTFSGLNTLSTQATINAFALQIFGNGSNADFTIGTSPSVANFAFSNGAKINNSGIGCDASNGAAGWLCGTANSTANAFVLAGNGSFSWSFTGTFAQTAVPLTQLDLMVNGTFGPEGAKYAYSDPLFDVNEQLPGVPEPASLMLLGSGLSAAALRLRKRNK